MSDGFGGRAFQTAARRRGGKPLPFRLLIVRTEPDGSNPVEEDHEFHIDPNLDVLRLGAVIGQSGTAVLTATSQTTPGAERVGALDVAQAELRSTFYGLLVPEERERWETVRDHVDFDTLGTIAVWARSELSGVDPTQQPSSPNGSDEISSALTAGAGHEVSTSEQLPSE